MAMMVVLLGDSGKGFSLRPDTIARLANLGVTNLAVVRRAETVGIVLEGWLFDPGRSGEAAAAAVGAIGASRSLHPVMQMAVSAALSEGGGDVRDLSPARA